MYIGREQEIRNKVLFRNSPFFLKFFFRNYLVLFRNYSSETILQKRCCDLQKLFHDLQKLFGDLQKLICML